MLPGTLGDTGVVVDPVVDPVVVVDPVLTARVAKKDYWALYIEGDCRRLLRPVF